jgi:membrane protein DedA with SNARE-associated domain
MLAILLQYRYFILLPITIIEGPVVSFIVGYLIYLGYLSLLPSAILLFLGDLIPDAGYYFLGYFADRSPFIKKGMQRFKLLGDDAHFLKSMWHTHTKKTLVFSKLAYGLSTPLIISAGIAKYPFRTFVTGTMSITILQYGTLMTLGYYFGASYEAVGAQLKEVGILIAVVAVIAIFYGYRKFTQSIADSVPLGKT